MTLPETGRLVRSVKHALALALVASTAAIPALASGPEPYRYDAPPAPYAPPAATPVSIWSGAYVGVALGYACCGRDRVQLAPAPPGVIGTMQEGGAFMGLHAGRDWQRGNRVVGIEGSLSFGNIGDSLTSGTASASVRINPVAEIRARAGYASGDGLLYVTGGVAAARVAYAAGDTAVPSDIRSTFTTPGLSLGFGYERMIGSNWSMRGEYSYTLFQARNLTDGVQTTRATPDFHAIRVVLSHRF
ncbi:MAG: outer membrane beta-barrel protein [Pararhodobacter sp.]|nr:outer membrane beta-barrel protein [Pararhodobacter sp.]